MKKLLFVIISLCGAFVNAQEYKIEGTNVVFTKIVEDTGLNEQETHDALESFFALRYNDVNSTQKLNQADHLIYKGLFMNVHIYGLGMWAIDVPHVVDIAIKADRLRIKVIINEGIIRSTQVLDKYTYSLTEYYPLGKKVERMFKKDAIKAFESTTNQIYILIEDIENSLKETVIKDEW